MNEFPIAFDVKLLQNILTKQSNTFNITSYDIFIKSTRVSVQKQSFLCNQLDTENQITCYSLYPTGYLKLLLICKVLKI